MLLRFLAATSFAKGAKIIFYLAWLYMDICVYARGTREKFSAAIPSRQRNAWMENPLIMAGGDCCGKRKREKGKENSDCSSVLVPRVEPFAIIAKLV